MLSLENFNALEETAQLLRITANARRPLAAMKQFSQGRGQERQVTEE